MRRWFVASALLFLSPSAAAVATAAADVSGRWQVTISIAGTTITGVALLKQTGDEVTGSIGADERNQHHVEGVVKGNTLTITTRPKPGRTVAFDRCDLTVEGEKMTGTTERTGSSDKGTIEFVRIRE